jgi:hypothetical protein
MKEFFAPPVAPSPLHVHLAGLGLPLVVTAWYDATFPIALALRSDWGQVQALSQSEHFGSWTACFDHLGQACTPEATREWRTLVYQPIGCVAPGANFLVSDSDFVEVLTEIDIQTPIPACVQELRKTRGFLFLGCRFDDQLQRTFARQIMKRSGGPSWAVLPAEPTRNEARFLEEQDIRRVELTLEEFAHGIIAGTSIAALA